MDRIRKLFGGNATHESAENGQANEPLLPDHDEESVVGDTEENPFSRVEYAVFLLLGVAMLWAWNMFLAAAPYFQKRFESNKQIYDNFQAAEISVSTVTNLCSMIILTNMQKDASYPRRIIMSLVLTTICFSLLALSTLVKVSAPVYFAFLMIMVCLSSFSTGLIQNGLFAYASGFGRGEYTQGIMTGQAVAGVLPCVAQIISVMAVPHHKPDHHGPPGEGLGQAPPKKDDGRPHHPPPPSESFKSALVYFLMATAISVAALFAFLYLLRRRSTSHPQPSSQPQSPQPKPTAPSNQTPTPKRIPLLHLFSRLPSLSTAVFLCFSITMTFPVFTSIIPSISHQIPTPIFIPLAFLCWNLGDLLGRLSTLIPSLHLYHTPLLLLFLALARLVFIPLYLLCNIRARGAVVPSDLFYLLVVQLLFGLSNGYLGSECMMGAGEWVSDDEKTAAGAWMGLCLVSGLTVGSLASFWVGGLAG